MRVWLAAFAAAVVLSTFSPYWASRLVTSALGRRGEISHRTPQFRSPEPRLLEREIGNYFSSDPTPAQRQTFRQWERRVPFFVSGVVTLSDGTTLVAAGSLYAFNKRGVWIWRFRPTRDILGPPLVVNDRVAYVATENAVFALDVRGALLWTVKRNGHRTDPPLRLGDDGSVIFTSRQSEEHRTLHSLWAVTPPAGAGQ